MATAYPFFGVVAPNSTGFESPARIRCFHNSTPSDTSSAFLGRSQKSQRQAQPNPAKSDPLSLAIRQDALSAADQVIDEIKEVEDLRSRVALTERIVHLLVKSVRNDCANCLIPSLMLIGAGNVYARLDTVRASEILRQIIKHTNRVEEFVGDSSIANILEIGGFYFDYSIYSNGLTIFDLIKRLAAVSYYGTLQDLRSLKNRILRLEAILALCSAVILDKNLAVLPLNDSSLSRSIQ